jgi:molecular chaperone DnaK
VRTTIDFGIDLGTMFSSIAVFNGSGADVFKNNEGQEFTPSAVWIDGKGRLYVGRLAKERLEDDSENAYCEFKLQMGKNQLYRFARSGRQMKPEELSAEVIKSLRGDVQQRTGEEVIAAVISVPAAFELPQTNATIEAAKLAGLEYTQLVSEPVAAAIAYGFNSRNDGIFWMVYNFGGGTFDVAIIQVLDGHIEVKDFNGDNYLGDKLIDWDIVERLFVSALTKKYKLSNFNRGNPKWKAAFAKLKLHAENSKMQLSRDNEVTVLIDPLCLDDRGAPVRFEYELKRGEVELITEPFIDRSVNLCKKTLQESGLSSGDIEKVILVGGATLIPIIRDMLSNKLNVPLDFNKDPLTIYAHGAAIFAGGVRIPERVIERHKVVEAGQYRIGLEYKPICSEREQLIGGKIAGKEGESLAGFTVEIVDEKTKWRSGKVNLSAGGTFTIMLRLADGGNEFSIELKDSRGNICQTVPDRFNITIYDGDLSTQHLINSVGIAFTSTEMVVFIPKGTPLPVRKRKILHTTREFKKGYAGQILRIPVVEGEYSKRADRNRLIGALEINSQRLMCDLPAGSEVEITIEVDESRIVRTKAYIPALDEEFEKVLHFVDTPADPRKLAEEFRREKVRFEKARIAFNRIHDEDMVHEIESLLAAASTDPDAAEKCYQRLLDFEIALDEIEEAVQNNKNDTIKPLI